MEVKPKKRKKLREWEKGLLDLVILCLLAASVLLFAAVNAKVVRLRNETVEIAGLQENLDGVRILFLSDFKVTDKRQARQAAALVEKLCTSDPDLVLLGGDIVTRSGTLRERTVEELKQARDVFLTEVNRLGIPVYAVYGDEDILLDAETASRLSNITYLNNEQKALRINGAKLTLYGVSDYSSGLVSSFDYVEDGASAVIALVHDPRAYGIISIETTNDVPCADLILAGHTLNGQCRFLGWRWLHTEVNDRLSYGWHQFSSPMLVTSGVGTEKLPLRLGTGSEALLITLKTAEGGE